MGTKVTAGMIGEEGKDNISNQDTHIDPPDTKDTGTDAPGNIEPGPDTGIGEVKDDDNKDTKDKPFKYKSHEEAEKGAQEAARKLTEVSTENSKLKKEIEDLQKKYEAQEKTDKGQTKSKWDIDREKIMKDTLTAASNLDAEDPNYQTKVAEVWLKGQAEISKISAKEVQETEKESAKDLEIINNAIGVALKTADLHEIHGIRELFDAQATKADRKLTLQEQIDWTVAQCKAIVDGIRGKDTSRKQKEQETREKFDAMGRGGRPNMGTRHEDEGSKTMGEARKVALERRKLKH